MKSESKLLLLVTGSFLYFFSACIKPAPEPKGPLIYFRWVQNLSFTPCGGCGYLCDMRSGNFKDNNNAVPDYAVEGTYYGPCNPGTYQAQFDFNVNAPGNNPQPVTYTLVKPAEGYTRYYTRNLREYIPGLNQCVSLAPTAAALTYTDVKQ